MDREGEKMRKVALNLINTSKEDDDESPERRGFNDSRFVPFLGFFSQGCFLEIRLAVWNVTDVFKYLKRRELFEQRVFFIYEIIHHTKNI